MCFAIHTAIVPPIAPEAPLTRITRPENASVEFVGPAEALDRSCLSPLLDEANPQ